jgi:protein-tyrosine phosphatase
VIAHPYWITTQLAIIPRPRGDDWLQDEMLALREAGVNVVVSMLEDEESAELGLRDEESAAARAGILFVNFPIPDRNVPADSQRFAEFLTALEKQIATGKRVGIHCRACIGRSSVVAVSLLIRSGVLSEKAWAQVSVARGFPVPDTNEQRSWVNLHIEANPS